MWVYYRVLYSVPLIYLSILSLIPPCLDYRSFILSLDIRYCQAFYFVLLLQYPVGYSGSFASPHKVRIGWSYPQNNLLGFWLEMNWICRSSWEELTSWQYQVFLHMNMEYLFILFFFDFFQHFCRFPHIHIILILLGYSLSISFWGHQC